MSRTPTAYKSIADYLDKTHTTHETFAAQLGISRCYVTLLANGVRSPGLRLALRITAITGIPVAALVVTQERASA